MAIALYARKSVERENSVSIETQLEYCRSMIRPDEKKEEVLVFTDNGFSGGNLERDGFRRMMELVCRGEIHKLIVYRLDRISRSLSDFVGVLETLKKYNVSFISSQESFDTGSPYGEMIVKLLMVFAEFERQSIISRVTQAYEHRSSMGLFMGGKAPYGFTLKETVIGGIRTKMLSPTEEKHHVAYIFERYAVSGVTLRKLMKELIRNGMLPPDGCWSAAKLSAILHNPIYVRGDNNIYRYFSEQGITVVSEISRFDGIHGVQMYGQSKGSSGEKKVVVMEHEGLVSSEIWLICQQKLEQNKQFGNALSNTSSWLGGMVVCGECGRTMTVIKGGKRRDGSVTRYFYCTGKSNGICEGPAVTLYTDSLEDLAEKVVIEKMTELGNFQVICGDTDTGLQNQLKNRLSEIAAAEERLVELTMNSSMEDGMLHLLNEKARNLSDEKQLIVHKIDEMESSRAKRICADDMIRSWESVSDDERKAVLRLLMQRIVIHRDGTAEIEWNL